jgi:hypothetical protein
VCGVHYTKPQGTAGDGLGGLVSQPALGPSNTPCIDFGEAIIFGAGITQKPTCNADTTTTDPYLGYGAHTGLADFTAGQFQLVVQTGPKNVNNGSGPGSTTQTGGEINTFAVNLAPPMSPTRIDSWAAVVE